MQTQKEPETEIEIGESSEQNNTFQKNRLFFYYVNILCAGQLV